MECRLNFRVFYLVCILSVSGCASKSQHSVLGTTWGFDAEKYNVRVLLDIRADTLRIRHVRVDNDQCVEGYEEHLELFGAIGPESTNAVDMLLPQLARCHRFDGTPVSQAVFMSSGGGRLLDGFVLGEIFRRNHVTTHIVNHQSCASSCAIAFLVGKFRKMEPKAELIFHAPYLQSYSSIDCSDRGQFAVLNKYFKAMLNSTDGEFLFERTLSFCSKSEGWVLNADDATLFGITN